MMILLYAVSGSLSAEEGAVKRQSLIIRYTNLLRRFRSPNAPAVKRFLQRHAADKIFARRAQTLNRVWVLKAKPRE